MEKRVLISYANLAWLFLFVVLLLVYFFCGIPGLRKKFDEFFNRLLPTVRAIEDLDDDKSNIDPNLLRETVSKFALAAFTVVFLVLLVSVFVTLVFNWEESQRTGPLGDLFNGLVAPLLTFMTFIGLLITIALQQIQMKATLAELKLTRTEMSESTKALEAQVSNSSAQKVDNNFFSLLNLQLKITDELTKSNEKELSTASVELMAFNSSGKLEEYTFANYPNLERFFSINLQMLEYINANDKSVFSEASLSEADVQRYYSIVRSSTPDELVSLMLIYATELRASIYKTAIERAGYFEGLDFRFFTNPTMLVFMRKYASSAFGDGRNREFFLRKRIIQMVGIEESQEFKTIDASIKSCRHIGIFEKGDNIRRHVGALTKHIDGIKSALNKLDSMGVYEDEIVFQRLLERDASFFIKKHYPSYGDLARDVRLCHSELVSAGIKPNIELVFLD